MDSQQEDCGMLPHCSAHWQRVGGMMAGFGQEVPESPTIPDAKTRELRVRLLLEEVLEYAEAAGVEVRVRAVEEGNPLTLEALDITTANLPGNPTPDWLEMADALADISVVNVGSMVAMGMPDIPFLWEVDVNNIRKIENGRVDETTGKFIKPANHQPPDLAAVARRIGLTVPESA